MDKPARKITRKSGDQAGRIAKRKPTKPAGNRAKQAPKFSLVTSNLDVEAPEGCSVSLLLKEVLRDAKTRSYALWLAAGRCDQDALSVRYKFTGESTVRCDVPAGTDASPAALQPYLVKFLADQHIEPGGTVIIIV